MRLSPFTHPLLTWLKKSRSDAMGWIFGTGLLPQRLVWSTCPARSRLVLLIPDWFCSFKTNPTRSRLVLLVQDWSTRSVLGAKGSFRMEVDTILESHKP
jgi:hypothetical protein